MAEIEGLVRALRRALREGDNAAKTAAARALGSLACSHANSVLIAEAGGIPSLVELLRDGDAPTKYQARWTLGVLADNNASNAVAIAATVGLEALVELARRGRVTVDDRSVVSNAGAKRKAALLVAALLGGCVPDSVPRVLKAAIGSYL
jgi:vacuolar protein 8